MDNEIHWNSGVSWAGKMKYFLLRTKQRDGDQVKQENHTLETKEPCRPPTVISTTFCIFFHYLTTHFNQLQIFTSVCFCCSNVIICESKQVYFVTDYFIFLHPQSQCSIFTSSLIVDVVTVVIVFDVMHQPSHFWWKSWVGFQ